MLIIGCDYHPSVQPIAVVDTETGDYGEHRLKHSDGEAEKFYRDLKRSGAIVRLSKNGLRGRPIRRLDVCIPGPRIANAVDAAIAVLRKMTASVEEVVLPPTAIPLDQIFIDVRSVEVYAYHSPWLSESPEKYQSSTRQRLVENAADVKPTDFVQSRRQLALLRREVKEDLCSGRSPDYTDDVEASGCSAEILNPPPVRLGTTCGGIAC